MAAAFGAAAAGEASLTGKWRIAEIRDAGPFDPSKTLFEVTGDGRIRLTVGCNRIAGKPALEGETIAFGAMAATRMACPPPLDQLETRYLAALAAARLWRIENGALTFADERGGRLLALRRAD